MSFGAVKCPPCLNLRDVCCENIYSIKHMKDCWKLEPGTRETLNIIWIEPFAANYLSKPLSSLASQIWHRFVRIFCAWMWRMKWWHGKCPLRGVVYTERRRLLFSMEGTMVHSQCHSSFSINKTLKREVQDMHAKAMDGVGVMPSNYETWFLWRTLWSHYWDRGFRSAFNHGVILFRDSRSEEVEMMLTY